MKKLGKPILLILLFALSYNSYACICISDRMKHWLPRVQRDYATSELVFMGEVISVGEQGYKVKVIDVFKGNISPDTILIAEYDSCSWLASKGLCMVYGNISDKGTLEVSGCSISRNLGGLFLVKPIPTPPLVEDYFTEKANDELQAEGLPILARKWLIELSMLRMFRKIQKEYQAAENNKDILIYIALSFLAFVATLCYYVLRKLNFITTHPHLRTAEQIKQKRYGSKTTFVRG